jgi:hypothetical protein
LAGGVLGQRVVVEGVKGVKYAPMPTRMYKNVEKTGSFAHVLAYKSLKTLFLAQRYLTRYTPEMFFEEYKYLKIFRLLRHCGVIQYLFNVSEVIYAHSCSY